MSTNINLPVKRERTFKYLRITFSENLTWSDHLNNISTKINQRIGLLRRIKAFIPLKTRLIIYNALILPLFDYGDIIWGDKNNSSLMNQLQVLQNKAAKTILDAPAYPHPLKPSTNYTPTTYPPTQTTPNTNHI